MPKAIKIAAEGAYIEKCLVLKVVTATDVYNIIKVTIND
jgi:hypothetical protein